MWMAIIVDDILYVEQSEGNRILTAFDAHMESKWPGMKLGGLDGFLNFEITRDQSNSTLTICCSARITALMAEHIPLELDSIKFPDTPYHPQLMELGFDELFKGVLSEEQRTALRLGMQLAYIATTVRCDIQYPLFYALRFTSRMQMPLGLQVLHHILCYLYGTRQLGHTLGGRGDAAMAVTGEFRLDSTPADFLVGGNVDAGHAEAGPSTGGFRCMIGTTTVHAKSGKHHGETTLSTSGAELIEVSNAVAFIEAQRDFVAELGFPQLQPAPLGCDNSAVVAISNKASAFKRSLYLYRRADFVLKSGDRKKIKVLMITSRMCLPKYSRLASSRFSVGRCSIIITWQLPPYVFPPARREWCVTRDDVSCYLLGQ